MGYSSGNYPKHNFKYLEVGVSYVEDYTNNVVKIERESGKWFVGNNGVFYSKTGYPSSRKNKCKPLDYYDLVTIVESTGESTKALIEERFNSYNSWKSAAINAGYEIHPAGNMYSSDFAAYKHAGEEVYGYWTGKYGNISSENTGWLVH